MIIFMFININENVKNKNVEKLRDVPTKLLITQLLTNLEYQNWCYINAEIVFVSNNKIQLLSNLTIHEL